MWMMPLVKNLKSKETDKKYHKLNWCFSGLISIKTGKTVTPEVKLYKNQNINRDKVYNSRM